MQACLRNCVQHASHIECTGRVLFWGTAAMQRLVFNRHVYHHVIVVLGLLILLSIQATSLLGQSAALPVELRKAIERLDTPNADDWTKSESTLSQLIKDDQYKNTATLTSALFRIKQAKKEAIENLCRNSKRTFQQLSPDQECLLLRIHFGWLLQTIARKQLTRI